MIDTKDIDVSRDFSKYPFGRYPKHSESCGENFRQLLLLPALRKHKFVRVLLDGVDGGYSSSFLDESFAGLVLKDNFSAAEVLERIEIVTQNDDWKIEIEQYVREAEQIQSEDRKP